MPKSLDKKLEAVKASSESALDLFCVAAVRLESAARDASELAEWATSVADHHAAAAAAARHEAEIASTRAAALRSSLNLGSI